MEYLHDVWVNWFEGEENGYNVCEYHEWRKTDNVEFLDQVPIIKVEGSLFDYIENDLCEVPEDILTKVHNQSFMRKNHDRIRLEYCFIIVCGFKTLVVDTCGFKIPIKKSRLTPAQEKIVLHCAESSHEEFTLPDVLKRKKEYTMLSPHPNTMYGLTRNERQLKQILFMGLEKAYETKNVGLLRYLYSEWNIKNYTSVIDLELDSLYKKLVYEVSKGWSKGHEKFCEIVVKGSKFCERLHELELASQIPIK